MRLPTALKVQKGNSSVMLVTNSKDRSSFYLSSDEKEVFMTPDSPWQGSTFEERWRKLREDRRERKKSSTLNKMHAYQESTDTTISNNSSVGTIEQDSLLTPPTSENCIQSDNRVSIVEFSSFDNSLTLSPIDLDCGFSDVLDLYANKEAQFFMRGESSPTLVTKTSVADQNSIVGNTAITYSKLRPSQGTSGRKLNHDALRGPSLLPPTPSEPKAPPIPSSDTRKLCSDKAYSDLPKKNSIQISDRSRKDKSNSLLVSLEKKDSVRGVQIESQATNEVEFSKPNIIAKPTRETSLTQNIKTLNGVIPINEQSPNIFMTSKTDTEAISRNEKINSVPSSIISQKSYKQTPVYSTSKMSLAEMAEKKRDSTPGSQRNGSSTSKMSLAEMAEKKRNFTSGLQRNGSLTREVKDCKERDYNAKLERLQTELDEIQERTAKIKKDIKSLSKILDNPTEYYMLGRSERTAMKDTRDQLQQELESCQKKNYEVGILFSKAWKRRREQGSSDFWVRNR